jgi:hypothetical protein
LTLAGRPGGRDLTSAMRNGFVTLAVLATLLACSKELREDESLRRCWENPSRVCDPAFVEFGCPLIPALVTASDSSTDGPIVVRLARDVENPPIGQLYSLYCPPYCIALVASGESPWRVLKRDVEGVLARSGYEVGAESAAPDRVLRLDLTWVDVRTDPPRWTDIHLTTRAGVTFEADLQSADGTSLWSEKFRGKAQVRHLFALRSDSQFLLDHAYCQAITSFGNRIQTIDLGHP